MGTNTPHTILYWYTVYYKLVLNFALVTIWTVLFHLNVSHFQQQISDELWPREGKSLLCVEII